jgi:hypothetical protein
MISPQLWGCASCPYGYDTNAAAKLRGCLMLLVVVLVVLIVLQRCVRLEQWACVCVSHAAAQCHCSASPCCATVLYYCVPCLLWCSNT